MSAGLHALLRDIGRLVALLHDGGLIHGDLTTSNMLLRSPDNTLVIFSAAPLYLSTHASFAACTVSLCCCLNIIAQKRRGTELTHPAPE